MKIKLYRITPTPTFWWNNRWQKRVKPKKHVFAIEWEPPYHRHHTKLWIDFLKKTKGRKVLYLHTIHLDVTLWYKRVLKRHKREDLIEVMIPTKHMGKLQIVKTVRV